MDFNSDKNKPKDGLSKVEESASLYQSKRDLDKGDVNEITQNTLLEVNNSEEMNPILVKLISKSIQDAKDGKGISNDEMNQRIKSKYPFLK